MFHHEGRTVVIARRAAPRRAHAVNPHDRFMHDDQWNAVDQYLVDLLMPADRALEAALAASRDAGLPAISVSPPLGKLLFLLARMQGARRILEIGTLGGYSTIWLARALPAGGSLITLEINPDHARVALANIERAGLSRLVQLRLGAARETLARLVADGGEPFDYIFIDADKERSPEYFDRALQLSRPGSVIIVDNVVRDGAVLDAASTDPNVRGVRRFNERLAAESRVSATTIQTVGAKGYDGFALALVTEGRDA